MQKIILFCILGLMLVLGFVFHKMGSAKKKGWPLAKAGAVECSIVIPEGRYEVALPCEERWNKTLDFAARFLQEYIMKVSGVKVPIVKEGEAKSKYKIYLGPTEKAKSLFGDLSKFEPEEFIIKSIEDGLVITGELTGEKLSHLKGVVPQEGMINWSKHWEKIDRGTLFGVYEFIERVLGVRFYFPGEIGTVIPKKNDVYISEMDIKKSPVFQSRRFNILGAPDAWAWHAVLKWGDSTEAYVNHNELYWAELYGKNHPEYFALREDGTRCRGLGHQRGADSVLCYSEPGVLAQFLENIEYFDKSGNILEEPPYTRLWNIVPTRKYVYFGPNDVSWVCSCAKCKKLYKEDADSAARSSELYFDFVAKYANEIKKRWPGRRLIALAYKSYTLAPATVKLPDNVDILVCFFSLPASSAQKDPVNYERVSNVINSWHHALGNDRKRLFVWDYTDTTQNLTDAPLLFPHVLSRRYKEYKDKLNGGFLEVMYHRGGIGETAPNRVDMQNSILWLWSRLMWDPELDVDSALDEFCANMFGPAAKTMKSFFNIQISRYENTKWKYPKSAINFSKLYEETYPRGVVLKLEALIEKALNEVVPGSIEYKRVAWYDNIYKPFFEGSYDADRFEYLEIPKGKEAFRGWSDEKTAVFKIDQEVGHKENGSLFIMVNQNAQSHSIWSSQKIPIKKGVYKVSVWVKTREATGSVFPGIKFYDEQNQNIAATLGGTVYGDSISGSNDWIELGVVAKAPDAAEYLTIELWLKRGKAKGVWFDDIRLKKFSDVGRP